MRFHFSISTYFSNCIFSALGKRKKLQWCKCFQIKSAVLIRLIYFASNLACFIRWIWNMAQVILTHFLFYFCWCTLWPFGMIQAHVGWYTIFCLKIDCEKINHRTHLFPSFLQNAFSFFAEIFCANSQLPWKSGVGKYFLSTIKKILWNNMDRLLFKASCYGIAWLKKSQWQQTYIILALTPSTFETLIFKVPINL